MTVLVQTYRGWQITYLQNNQFIATDNSKPPRGASFQVAGYRAVTERIDEILGEEQDGV